MLWWKRKQNKMPILQDFRVLNYTSKCVVLLVKHTRYTCVPQEWSKGFPGHLLTGQTETSVMEALCVT